jgi:RND family efflux transporter MFP subunit
VPEGEASRIRPGMEVIFKGRNEDYPYKARLVHVAERAEESSRMVDMTARVEDPAMAKLLPGTFAEVLVAVGSAPNTPVIPQTAVRPSERGFLAFVIEGEVAHERVLELGLRTPDGLVEVRSGLEPGETLVIRGSEALRDGAKVAVSTGSAAKADPGAAADSAAPKAAR